MSMSEGSEDPYLDWKRPVLFCIYGLCFVLLFHTLYKGIKRRCLRRRTARRLLSQNNPGDASPQLESGGMTSSIVQSLPAIQFGEKTKQREDDGHGACSICLGEFEGGEWLRLLPNCAHIFHASCVDPWFLSHSTCPLCRTEVLGDCSNNGDSSASTTALWGTLPREGANQGRPLGYNLLESEANRNRELRWEAVRGDRPRSDSGEQASTSNV